VPDGKTLATDALIKSIEAARSYYPAIPADIENESAQRVSATTPVWRKIRITDVTAAQCAEAGRVLGLPEMPIWTLFARTFTFRSARGGTSSTRGMSNS